MDDVVDRQDFERRNFLTKQETLVQTRKLSWLYFWFGLSLGGFVGFIFALAFAAGFLQSLVH
jgi:hypothetical protein